MTRLLLALLGVGLIALSALIAASRRNREYYVSSGWQADERLKVLRRSAEWEGVNHAGKFKR